APSARRCADDRMLGGARTAPESVFAPPRDSRAASDGGLRRRVLRAHRRNRAARRLRKRGLRIRPRRGERLLTGAVGPPASCREARAGVELARIRPRWCDLVQPVPLAEALAD